MFHRKQAVSPVSSVNIYSSPHILPNPSHMLTIYPKYSPFGQTWAKLLSALFSPGVNLGLPCPALPGPVLARLSLSQFREDCAVVVSDHPWYLIKFLISHPGYLIPMACLQQEFCSVAIAKNPPTLGVSSIPSTEHLTLLFGYKPPAISAVFRVEPHLSLW